MVYGEGNLYVTCIKGFGLFVQKEELEQLKTYYVLQLVRGYTSLSAAGCRADVVCGDLTSLGSG